MQKGLLAHPIFLLTPVLSTVMSINTTNSSVLMYAGSDLHFAVLTSDNCWRLYHADNLAEPEQTFELQTSTKRYTNAM